MEPTSATVFVTRLEHLATQYSDCGSTALPLSKWDPLKALRNIPLKPLREGRASPSHLWPLFGRRKCYSVSHTDKEYRFLLLPKCNSFRTYLNRYYKIAFSELQKFTGICGFAKALWLLTDESSTHLWCFHQIIQRGQLLQKFHLALLPFTQKLNASILFSLKISTNNPETLETLNVSITDTRRVSASPLPLPPIIAPQTLAINEADMLPPRKLFTTLLVAYYIAARRWYSSSAHTQRVAQLRSSKSLEPQPVHHWLLATNHLLLYEQILQMG